MKTPHLNGTVKSLKPYLERLADERVWEHLREALGELQDAKDTAQGPAKTQTILDRLSDERLWTHLSTALGELNGAADLTRGRKQHRWGLMLGGAALVAGVIFVARSSGAGQSANDR